MRHIDEVQPANTVLMASTTCGGEFSDVDAEQERCHSLRALLAAPAAASASSAASARPRKREALLFVRRTDASLSERCRLLREEVATTGARGPGEGQGDKR
jgi:hypothetical protein